jgi:hypothetical protein
MKSHFRELEHLDDRILCALRCVDATSRVAVDRPLTIRATTSPPPRIQRNGRGLFVVREWAPLADYADAFLQPVAPPAPEPPPLVLAIHDPMGRYLPRLVQLRLPRDPDPLAENSLFAPVDVPLYGSSIAPLQANWAVVRVAVQSADEALGGALVLVWRQGNLLATALSDWRGEALVAIAGVPIISFSGHQNAALGHDLEVVVEAVFDPAVGTRIPLAKVRDGPPPAQLPLVDPEALFNDRNRMPRQQRNLPIAARAQITTSLQIDSPQ